MQTNKLFHSLLSLAVGIVMSISGGAGSIAFACNWVSVQSNQPNYGLLSVSDIG